MKILNSWKITVLSLLMGCISLHAKSQETFDFLASADSASYVGIHIKRPFFKRDFEPWDYWSGLNVKMGVLTAGFSYGSFTDPTKLDFIGPKSGWMFNLGMHYPLLKNRKPRRRLNLTSIGFEPYIESGLACTRIGVDGPENKSIGYGIQAFPGLLIRLSSLYIDLRPELNLLVNNPFLMKKDSRNAASGFIFMPTVSIGCDGMFDVFNPIFNSRTDYDRVTKTKIHFGGVETSYYYSPSLKAIVEVRKINPTTHETWEEDKWTTHNQYLNQAFWYVGPRVKFMQTIPERERTMMYGVNAGARFGSWGLDMHYSEGSYGLHSGIATSDLLNAFPKEQEVSLRSDIDATELGASVLFHPWGYAFSNAKNPFLNEVSFFRLSAKLNFSHIKFQGGPRYANVDGQDVKNSYFFLNPELIRSSSNDASRLPEQVHGFGWGIAVEFGAGSVNFDQINYKDAPIANQKSFSLALNIPWQRLAQKSKAKREVRKLVRGN